MMRSDCSTIGQRFSVERSVASGDRSHQRTPWRYDHTQMHQQEIKYFARWEICALRGKILTIITLSIPQKIFLYLEHVSHQQ